MTVKYKQELYSNNSSEILNTIRFEFNSKRYAQIKEKLTNILGVPDNESFGHIGMLKYYVPHKYYITLSIYNFLEISAIDFIENKTFYDEFLKIGYSYFGYSPYKRIGYDHLTQYFVFYYDKIKNYNGVGIKTEYKGENWIFMQKIEYLLDNGEVLKIEIYPKRITDNFFGDISCLENDITIVGDDVIDKLLDSKNVKVKISGDSHYIMFDLSPLHKYQMLSAKFNKSRFL